PAAAYQGDHPLARCEVGHRALLDRADAFVAWPTRRQRVAVSRQVAIVKLEVAAAHGEVLHADEDLPVANSWLRYINQSEFLRRDHLDSSHRPTSLCGRGRPAQSCACGRQADASRKRETHGLN